MHIVRRIPPDQTTHPQTKVHVKSAKIFSFLVIIILCLILYFVYYIKVNDIYGKAPTTYFHFMFNRTLSDYNPNKVIAGSHRELTFTFKDFYNNNGTQNNLRKEATVTSDSSDSSSATPKEQNSNDQTTETTTTKVTTTTTVDTQFSNYETSSAAVEKESSEPDEDNPEEDAAAEDDEKETSTEDSTADQEETSTIEISSTSTESSGEDKHESAEEFETSTAEYIEKTDSVPDTTTTAETQVILRLQGNMACKLPILQPFDDAIKDVWKGEDHNSPAKCYVKYPQVFRSTLNSKIIKLKHTTEWKDCCYVKITRPSKFSSSVDKTSVEEGDCIPLRDRITKMPNNTESVAIKCAIPDRQNKALNTTDDVVMIDAFSFIPIKKKVERRIASIVPQQNPEHQVNLVIFGIDAVSHMNFMRIMPKVYSYLTKNLSAIGMNGYVKIGDNTFPNILAALTGQTVSESNTSCIKDNFFDNCPFVFKEYAARGYRTAYSEDAPWMASFNYAKNRGFAKSPVDYYPRPLSILSDETLGNDHRVNANICYGPRLAIDFLLDHLKKVAFIMKPGNRRYFHFTWCTSLTHDYLTLGKHGEDALLKTLKWFNSSNNLNNTVFVLMSDHGIRYGKFRNTKQGKIEENLPFVYFTFPQWFREKYPRAIQNMRENNFRLTTPFDLHQTFLDLADLKTIEDEEIKSREVILNSNKLDGKLPRGISFFLPCPIERTCGMAEIPEHFCVCRESVSLPENHPLTLQATNFAIYQLNSFISAHPQCSYLSLAKVNSAHQFFSDVEQYKNTSVVLEGVKTLFKVNPGESEFDATVVRLNGTNNWTLSDISRVNLYGNQSHCVDEATMKKYCFCTDLLHTEESDSGEFSSIDE